MISTRRMVKAVSKSRLGEIRAKEAAATHALSLVRDGMKLGLGTGSTADIFVELLGEQVRSSGTKILATATSTRTRIAAEQAGIGIKDLNELGRLDLTLDGADEFDSNLHLIKGGGGALLQEKIVAVSSNRFIVIASASKRVDVLGRFPLPVEIVRFGWKTTAERVRLALEAMGMATEGRVRGGEASPFISDEGHVIVDYQLNRIPSPKRIERVITEIIGVVECGLFTGLCDQAIAGNPDGTVSVFESGIPPLMTILSIANHQAVWTNL